MTKAQQAAKIEPAKESGAQENGKSARSARTPEAGRASGPADTAASPTTQSPFPPKQPSKQGRLTAMLVRDEGATLDAMVEATGWLKHTVRAALTGLKKKGFVISSDKVDGLRTYRAVAPE